MSIALLVLVSLLFGHTPHRARPPVSADTCIVQQSCGTGG